MLLLLNQSEAIKIISYIKLTSSQVAHFNFIILYKLQDRIQNFMLTGHLGCF